MKGGAERSKEDLVQRAQAGGERAFADVLAKMPEDYRTVIELLQDRRMTVAEAAARMDRSENAVKKLHARALDRMAREMGLLGGEDDGSI